MNQRIQQFLAAENITQSQFAETIDVAKATISHIISGRNKPGFDFIESVSRHYPSLNIEWLITGKGKMYKNQADSEPDPATKPVQASNKEYFGGDLFDMTEQISPSINKPKTTEYERFDYISEAAEKYNVPTRPTEAVTSEIAAAENALKRAAERKKPQSQPQPAPSAVIKMNSNRRISKIIVFYDDNSYQELS